MVRNEPRKLRFLKRKRISDTPAAGPGTAAGDSAGSGDSDRGDSAAITADGDSGSVHAGGDPEPSHVDGEPVAGVDGDRGESGDPRDGGSDGGDSGTAAAEPSVRRGRHPHNCQCPKHRGTGNQGGTEEKEENRDAKQSSPRAVEFEDLFGFGGKGKRAKPEAALGSLYQMAFEVVSFSPAGRHWAISAQEAAMLGRYSVAAIDSISATSKQKFSRFAEKNLPWVALVATAAVITVPRIQLTRMQLELARQNAGAEPPKESRNNVPERTSPPNPTKGVGENERPADAPSILGSGFAVIERGVNPQASLLVPRFGGRAVSGD